MRRLLLLTTLLLLFRCAYSQDENSQLYKANSIPWVRIEGEHITYYFFDAVHKQALIKRYIAVHERAYEKIDSVFHATLPTKMKFYVWYSDNTAKKYLNRGLGFTLPGICVSEVNISQSVGHEMAHTLAYWAWGSRPIAMTRFINEGIAVAFDQNDDDKLKRARWAVGYSHANILDMWNNNADPDALYPVAGAFIAYLYKISTPAQFQSLVKNQTVENAYKIYGKEKFDAIIKNFELQLKGDSGYGVMGSVAIVFGILLALVIFVPTGKKRLGK